MECFDVVEMVLDEANKQFAPLWKEDVEKKEELRQWCSKIDAFAKVTDAAGYEVEVDDLTLKIYVEVIWEKENNEAKLGFVFPSVWKHFFCEEGITNAR